MKNTKEITREVISKRLVEESVFQMVTPGGFVAGQIDMVQELDNKLSANDVRRKFSEIHGEDFVHGFRIKRVSVTENFVTVH